MPCPSARSWPRWVGVRAGGCWHKEDPVPNSAMTSRPGGQAGALVQGPTRPGRRAEVSRLSGEGGGQAAALGSTLPHDLTAQASRAGLSAPLAPGHPREPGRRRGWARGWRRGEAAGPAAGGSDPAWLWRSWELGVGAGCSSYPPVPWGSHRAPSHPVLCTPPGTPGLHTVPGHTPHPQQVILASPSHPLHTPPSEPPHAQGPLHPLAQADGPLPPSCTQARHGKAGGAKRSCRPTGLGGAGPGRRMPPAFPCLAWGTSCLCQAAAWLGGQDLPWLQRESRSPRDRGRREGRKDRGAGWSRDKGRGRVRGVQAGGGRRCCGGGADIPGRVFVILSGSKAVPGMFLIPRSHPAPAGPGAHGHLPAPTQHCPERGAGWAPPGSAPSIPGTARALGHARTGQAGLEGLEKQAWGSGDRAPPSSEPAAPTAPSTCSLHPRSVPPPPQPRGANTEPPAS